MNVNEQSHRNLHNDHPPAGAESGLTSAAAAVAYAGSLPLLAGAILAWARPTEFGPTIVSWISLYGVALLAFFGGVRWGVAVMTARGPTFLQLAGSVVPLVLSVLIFALSPNVTTTLTVLVIVIPLLLLDDLRATRRGSGAPAWYLGVRVPLTVMMEVAFVACLGLALARGIA